MNLSNKNFSQTTLTQSVRDKIGPEQRLQVKRYTYESSNGLYDVDCFETPLILDGKEIRKVYRINSGGMSLTPHVIHLKIKEHFNL